MHLNETESWSHNGLCKLLLGKSLTKNYKNTKYLLFGWCLAHLYEFNIDEMVVKIIPSSWPVIQALADLLVDWPVLLTG